MIIDVGYESRASKYSIKENYSSVRLRFNNYSIQHEAIVKRISIGPGF